MRSIDILASHPARPTSHSGFFLWFYFLSLLQAIILILEGEHSPDVKEQALCILANIADGDVAKSAIMSNEDVLKKLMNYMVWTSSYHNQNKDCILI